MGRCKRVSFQLACLSATWLLISACDRLSVKETLTDAEFELTSHQEEPVLFPKTFEGNILLVGYVYTYCPDVCPLITHKMIGVQRSIGQSEDVHFVLVTFDPDRDSPEVLAEYASLYGLDPGNWTLLTGDRKTISALTEQLGVTVVKTPTRFTESGDPIYFMDHTDRVTLIDEQGQVRRHYYGSDLNVGRVQKDIQTLRSNH